MAEPDPTRPPSRGRFPWPWLALALMAVPAVWHVVDFPEDVDVEFPFVDRPTFNAMPPPAYRLAEPGDTIDRVGIYLAAGASAVALIGLARSRNGVGLWPSALALGLAGLWHAATPGPTFDGWHGLGFRVVPDPSAPAAVRGGVGAGLLALVAVVGLNLKGRRGLWRAAGEARIRGLLVAAGLLVLARQFDLPGVEPRGYWPRWAFDAGLLAFGLALVRVELGRPGSRRARVVGGMAAGLVAAALIVGGVWLSWYHRPLDRLRTVEPGRIYISAMPTGRGLRVAQARHGFRTIINLFPEDTPLRSPRLDEEVRFAREHGIRFIQATSEDNESDAFLDRTLAIAADPSSWPILVHCHGCMDRSPGWMGIYRFVVQGRPLVEVMKEIEAHRGYRPKAIITLIYNRVLAPRAPDRYRDDPTARVLRESARGMALDRGGGAPRPIRPDEVAGPP